MLSLVRKISRLIKIISGAFVYCGYVVLFGSYRGGAKFMRLAQVAPASFLGDCSVAFLESPPARLAIDYAYQRENRARRRLSPQIAALYSDDSLQGYGEEFFSKGGETLLSQQRGQIIPLLKKRFTGYEDRRLTIVELGIGNGDVIAHLATEFPQHSFIGVDFSTAIAAKKHGQIQNLQFINGYVIQLLEKSLLKGDLLYASSTLTLMLPEESSQILWVCCEPPAFLKS